MKKKNVKKQDAKKRQSRQEIESLLNKILGLKENFDIDLLEQWDYLVDPIDHSEEYDIEAISIVKDNILNIINTIEIEPMNYDNSIRAIEYMKELFDFYVPTDLNQYDREVGEYFQFLHEKHDAIEKIYKEMMDIDKNINKNSVYFKNIMNKVSYSDI